MTPPLTITPLVTIIKSILQGPFNYEKLLVLKKKKKHSTALHFQIHLHEPLLGTR